MRTTDVLVLGAGAAGLMCAATAGYRGRRVEVLDHAPKAAGKIRISGGGKCNFTNRSVEPEHYLCGNPHFVKSALARYQPQDFIDLVARHGLAYEERELGKLFCQNRAGDLIQILRTECDWAGVEFQLNTRIERVETLEESSRPLRFRVVTDQSIIECESLVVATGGLSFPKLKASGFGYRLAEQFGLAVTEKRPCLVPLVFDGKLRDFCAAMAGVSLDVTLSNQDATQSFSEALLFTHQGLSGPGVLQISNYWRPGEAIRVNLLPGLKVTEALLHLKQENLGLKKWLNGFWPKKFTQAWLERTPLPEPLAELPDERLRQYAEQLTDWTLYPSDTAGYDKAEVTLGGIDTDAISSKTLEVKNAPGLYFIGEVLDVTGQLGGYNFQWAWSSGFAAGQSA